MNHQNLVRSAFSIAVGLMLTWSSDSKAAVTAAACDQLLHNSITQKRLSITFLQVSRVLYGAQASMYKTMSVNAQNLSNSYASQFITCTVSNPIEQTTTYSYAAVSGGDVSTGGDGVGGAGPGDGGDGAGGGL